MTFSWNGQKQDNYDIYVVLTSGGAPLRLTTNHAPDTAPTWSPDGRYIAFIRDPGPNCAVYLISPLGGADRKIAETKGHSVCWTSDSTSIGVPNDASGISLVSIASGDERRLTTAPRNMVDDDCAFSQDGKYLAFVRWGSIYVSSSSGANAHRVTSGEHWVDGLAWIPGRRELLIGTSRTIAWRPSLARLSVNDRSTGVPSPYPWGENASRPSISRSSVDAPRRLVYERELIESNLYSLEVGVACNSRIALPASQPVFAPSTRVEADPQFSPDGRRIAFASDRAGDLAIWLCNSDGSDLAQLTNIRGCAAGSPRWSPDSRRLAFDCASAGNYDIYIVSAEGGPARRLTIDVLQKILPSWSHDGHWVYFSSNRSGVSEVWKARPEGDLQYR